METSLVNFIDNGKQTCVNGIIQMNEHIKWLKSRGFTDETLWIIEAKETLGFWVDMLCEWDTIERRGAEEYSAPNANEKTILTNE